MLILFFILYSLLGLDPNFPSPWIGAVGDSGYVKSEGYAKQEAEYSLKDKLLGQCYALGGNELGNIYHEFDMCNSKKDKNLELTQCINGGYSMCLHDLDL